LFLVLAAIGMASSCSLLDLRSTALIQEDPDQANVRGCWTKLPAGGDCDRNQYLIDGIYETGAAPLIIGQEAVLEVLYIVPPDVAGATWKGDLKTDKRTRHEYSMGTTWDESLDCETIEVRITIRNQGAEGSPYWIEARHGWSDPAMARTWDL